MEDKLLDEMDEVLEKRVRPSLRAHRGDVAIENLDDTGTLWISLHGECVGCACADETATNLIQKEICAAFPQVKKVEIDNGITAEIMEQAMALMTHRHSTQAQSDSRL
jgi:Fe-S cluster biogenesis protein NfuA